MRPIVVGPGSASALGTCTMCCAETARVVRCVRGAGGPPQRRRSSADLASPPGSFPTVRGVCARGRMRPMLRLPVRIRRRDSVPPDVVKRAARAASGPQAIVCPPGPAGGTLLPPNSTTGFTFTLPTPKRCFPRSRVCPDSAAAGVVSEQFRQDPTLGRAIRCLVSSVSGGLYCAEG